MFPSRSIYFKTNLYLKSLILWVVKCKDRSTKCVFKNNNYHVYTLLNILALSIYYNILNTRFIFKSTEI